MKRFILFSISTCLAAFVLLWWVIPFCLNTPDLKLSQDAESQLVLDRDGLAIHHFSREDHIRHRYTSFQSIPEPFIHATLAAEDKRFWEHGGVDLLASSRSFKDLIKSRRIISGASTITQQTVKLASTPAPRNFSNKFIEALKARKLEMSYSKSEILESYFNHLPYGNRTQGPAQASLHYFNKPLEFLSLAEYALLAALPQAPTRHNPRQNLAGAIKRRNWVLDRMQSSFGYSAKQIKRAKAEAIVLAPSSELQMIPELKKLFVENPETKIRTTLSSGLLTEIKSITKRELSQLQNQNVNNAAVVVIHNPTGEILCLLGSPNFYSAPGGQYNAALLPRSPGSALKPFVYLMGFEKQLFTPASIIADIPTSYPGERGPESFVNYDRKHHGPVTISYALANSLNIPAVKVLNQSGGATQLLHYLKKFGIQTLGNDANRFGLSLAIGGGEVTLLQLTNAFATIARMGTHIDPHIVPSDTTAEQIADPTQCYLLAQILSDNGARNMTFGNQSHLHLPFRCAAKTGTSTDYKDNFCVGFTADFTVGVWVGNVDNSPMQKVSGVTGAGPIFKQTMLTLHQNKQPKWFKRPQGVRSYAIDPHNGKRLPKSHPRRQIAQHLALLHQPAEAESIDYREGKPLLNNRFYSWVNDHTDRFAMDGKNDPNPSQHLLQILIPSRNATYLLDPDLPLSGQKLRFKSNSRNVIWTSTTLAVDGDSVILVPGSHTVTAVCPDTHQQESVHFTVENM